MRAVIPVRTALGRRCFVGMIVQFSRSAKRRCSLGLNEPVSQNSTACACHEGGRQVRSTLGTGSSSRCAVCASGLRRRSKSWSFPRKEVIQPHLPVRLPCYDFTPVTSPTFDGSLPQGVRPPASGVACFHGVTGGVYKARERIHRGNADPRLLATPPSCRRVSACNPNRDAL
jgi:hypothetical protein